MSASVEKCESYVRSEITRVEEIPNNIRHSGHYVRRNIFLYSWILQRKNNIVNRNELINLIGDSLKDAINIITDLDLIYHYAQIKGELIVLTENMLKAIERVFDDAQYNYHITKPVPYFDGITGEKLINYLNSIEKTKNTTILDIFRDAFTKAFIGISWIPVNPNSPETVLISSPDRSWVFLLCIHQDTGAMSPRDAEHLIAGLWKDEAYLRQESKIQGKLAKLIFTSSIDYEEAIEIRGDDNLYYAWSLSVLKFFHLLASEIRGDEQIATKFLPVIFEDQDGLAWSSYKAVKLLKQKISEFKKKESG